MRWKQKALIQNMVALLPSSLSYASYYWIQRHFGGLRQFDPRAALSAAIITWGKILDSGAEPIGKTFFEVGTGRAPFVPLAYWLMGADKTITIDLNPYMKAELINEGLHHIVNHRAEIEELFGTLLNSGRFEALLALSVRPNFSQQDFLELCRIRYIAPGDAARTGLAAESIDFHTSVNVFEHIPKEVLQKILEEGNRIMRDGLFVHRIDYSDHFAHSDKTISIINFLQYSDEVWQRYAGNRYMYMNRLRHDDYLALFQAAGHEIVMAEPGVDASAQELLSKGALSLNRRFSTKSPEILAIIDSWVVSRKLIDSF